MQIAEFTAQLFRIEMSGIGSLYLDDEDTNKQANTSPEPHFTIGETVLPPFRGAFPTTQAYITPRIAFAQHFASKLDRNDEDDAEHYEDIQAVLSGVQKILPSLFQEDENVPTILCNRDISTSNVLVTPDGDLFSIVDWECCAFLPPSLATQISHFLKGPQHDVLPAFPADASSDVYREALERYEKTRLREFFVEEMARVEPRWGRVFEQTRKMRDVVVAIEHFENDVLVKWAREWVGALVARREPKKSLGAVGTG
ncbi:hypothetical protein CC86DRAFT_461383 [Ophiobolus disseminans]|uniref:Uncharacterized protein n=1 Tax=Ophiobolus disseminans TaxID=1469910 RepID=A0A6A7AHX5_9PLEO|nr:hypothetical protein CC86DRAFT_461383 [Ophiobolus disseminans]